MRRFKFTLDNGTRLTIKPPTLRQYYKGLMIAKTDPQLFRSIAEICNANDEGIPITEEYVIDNFNTDDLSNFLRELPAWVKEERASDPNS
ncbi:MAG: hypothetical protein GXY08_01760 [Ruminococcus sp.]|nr:hypothetical protein [Ruminococcus sp.]